MIRRAIAAVAVACAAGLAGTTIGFPPLRAEGPADPARPRRASPTKTRFSSARSISQPPTTSTSRSTPQANKLRVMLAGVTLRDYHIRHLKIGVPRSCSSAGRANSDGVEHRLARAGARAARERDRFEIVATGDSTTMPDLPIPPLPEEAYTVPPRYFIRYGGGFSIEIRSESGTGTGTKVSPTFWESLLAPFRKSLAEQAAADTESVRLMLQLPDEGAGALYRSLPPDTDFIILYDPEPGK